MPTLEQIFPNHRVLTSDSGVAVTTSRPKTKSRRRSSPATTGWVAATIGADGCRSIAGRTRRSSARAELPRMDRIVSPPRTVAR